MDRDSLMQEWFPKIAVGEELTYFEHYYDEEDMSDWLANNVGKNGIDYEIRIATSGPSFYTIWFSNEFNALLFRLRWE